MRYRRVRYRYAEVVRAIGPRPLGDLWQVQAYLALADTVWRPPADVYETSDSVYVRIELAGVNDDDVQVSLYADTLVVEGQRQYEPLPTGARYHAAEIRYGPFRLEVPLPCPVDADRATARYERGFLVVQLPLQKAGAS